MLDLNPYRYNDAKYYEYEMQAAKRNLNFVVCGAKDKIMNLSNEECEQIVSACEAVVLANEKYLSAKKRYEEAKEDNPNE